MGQPEASTNNPKQSPPSSQQPWNHLGQWIDQQLLASNVGLTMGGEPTFVARGGGHLPEWQTEALGEQKRQLATRLLAELRRQVAPPGSVLHFGLGKLYPGEPQPRWALGCYWRRDGMPLWQEECWLAEPGQDNSHGLTTAQRFMAALVSQLGVDECLAIATFHPPKQSHPAPTNSKPEQ